MPPFHLGAPLRIFFTLRVAASKLQLSTMQRLITGLMALTLATVTVSLHCTCSLLGVWETVFASAEPVFYLVLKADMFF